MTDHRRSIVAFQNKQRTETNRHSMCEPHHRTNPHHDHTTTNTKQQLAYHPLGAWERNVKENHSSDIIMGAERTLQTTNSHIAATCLLHKTAQPTTPCMRRSSLPHHHKHATCDKRKRTHLQSHTSTNNYLATTTAWTSNTISPQRARACTSAVSRGAWIKPNKKLQSPSNTHF